MLYKSPIGPLSLIADDRYLFGIWIEEESDFEKGFESAHTENKHFFVYRIKINYIHG